MKKKSRLRVQKTKKGRRVLLYLLMFVVLGGIAHQLEQHFEITTSIKDVLHTIKVTFSQAGPVRGVIYDRNFKQLAVTLERVSVYVRIREIDSIQNTAIQLSQVLALDRDKLEEGMKSGVLRFWIAKDISQEQEISIKNLKLPGVYLQRDDKRYYPNNEQAAHFVGYVDNGIGLSGVEFYYDRLLANRKLKKQEEKQPLSNGLDLVLTIDLKIQDILDNLVKDIALSEQADKVALYLLESETGEIIGGANLPGFNPNNFTKYSQKQTENLFLLPLCLPEKYRLFLRDATMLQAHGVDGISPSAWSLVSGNNDLGSQLRLWEWLGLEGALETDFHVPTQSGKTGESPQGPVLASAIDFVFVPEFATPLSLLASYSTLLNKGKKIHPFVVKKILDNETAVEVLLREKEVGGGQVEIWPDAEGERSRSLFRSQARRGVSNTYFFRDSILVSVDHGSLSQFMINDLLFVTIPAGSNDLNMLLVVQRNPRGGDKNGITRNGNLEQLVEEKVEKISMLQQIAKSVADVVEPEMSDEDNYQGNDPQVTELYSGATIPVEKKTAPGVMPDIKGLSLRKSLRLLQGIDLKLNIQGTGRVIGQRPQAGSSLKGVTECVLILEKQEDIAPEKLSKGLSEKN